MKPYYTKANNKHDGTVRAEMTADRILKFLENEKNEMFKAKAHKDEIGNLQKAIDLIALNKYHAEVINNRKFQEDLD